MIRSAFDSSTSGGKDEAIDQLALFEASLEGEDKEEIEESRPGKHLLQFGLTHSLLCWHGVESTLSPLMMFYQNEVKF